ncbi:MAG: hypothetical protein QNJ71_02735 [Acidimicrobiia bacterium]|nr:hypothetical protein [Acidimicrobiia bacterium]
MAAAETATIPLGSYEFTIATNAGPRVLGYRRKQGVNPFAELPNDVIPLQDGRKYRFLGGHRLWRAPEIPAVTYEPDDRPVKIDDSSRDIDISGPADRNGIAKRITVSQRGNYSIVDHALENHGQDTVLSAPWAITQLKPGGFAYLPLAAEPSDPDAVQPNRLLVLWPYTDLSAPEIQFTERLIMVHGSERNARLKVGVANTQGWVAYHYGDELFVIWSHVNRAEGYYVDHGASVQCYRDGRFLELETLGSRAQLAPGERVTHREVWTLIDLGGQPPDDVLADLPETPDGIFL